jgi:hypothetical protein
LNRNPDHDALQEVAQLLAPIQKTVGFVGYNTIGDFEACVFRDIPFEDVASWLQKLSRLRHAVCRIECPLDGATLFGTGFLVAPDIVLTNHHVAKHFWNNNDVADRVHIRFGYEAASNGSVSEGASCTLVRDWTLPCNPVEDCDFAFLRLNRRPADDQVEGQKRDVLSLEDQSASTSSPQPLLILQHPAASPLKLAFGTLERFEGSKYLWYRVNTTNGSSGAPCLNQHLQVIGLHHFGAPTENRGIAVSAIRPSYLRIAQTGASGSGEEHLEESCSHSDTASLPQSRSVGRAPTGQGAREESDAPRVLIPTLPASPLPTIVVCYFHPECRSTLPALRQAFFPEAASNRCEVAAHVEVCDTPVEALKRYRKFSDNALLLLDGFPLDGAHLRDGLDAVPGPKRINVIYNDPEWPNSSVTEASASMIDDVHSITNSDTLIAAIRKALLRVRTQQCFSFKVLRDPEDLQRFFELRYRIWSEKQYLEPRKVCPECPWEVDYTDRTSLPVGFFFRATGAMIAGGRLVQDFGMEDPDVVSTIENMLRDRGAETLIRNFCIPTAIKPPFDIISAFSGFQSYYCRLVRSSLMKAEVSRIVVETAYRDRGLGETLVDTLCSLARSRDIQTLFLACHAEHETFYARSGFRLVPDAAGKFLTYDVPAVAMERTMLTPIHSETGEGPAGSATVC